MSCSLPVWAEFCLLHRQAVTFTEHSTSITCMCARNTVAEAVTLVHLMQYWTASHYHSLMHYSLGILTFDDDTDSVVKETTNNICVYWQAWWSRGPTSESGYMTATWAAYNKCCGKVMGVSWEWKPATTLGWSVSWMLSPTSWWVINVWKRTSKQE